MRIQQTNRDRDMHRQLAVLSRGWWTILYHRQRIRLGSCIIVGRDLHAWRTCLAVPALELAEIAAIRVAHRGAEIIASHGLSVMATEVKIHALAEALAAQQSLHHAHDLGTFFVNR